jgi:membrane protein YdbS with pleckstrin-like domain
MFEKSDLQKSLEEMREPKEVKRLKKDEGATLLVLAIIWIPAVLSTVVWFIVGNWSYCWRSAVVAIVFIWLAYRVRWYTRKKVDTELLKSKKPE